MSPLDLELQAVREPQIEEHPVAGGILDLENEIIGLLSDSSIRNAPWVRSPKKGVISILGCATLVPTEAGQGDENNERYELARHEGFGLLGVVLHTLLYVTPRR